MAARITVAPEIGVSRVLPPDEALARVRPCLGTGVWRSIDLYDDEQIGNVADFVPLYRLAAEHGLRLKAHAGELCGAESVRRSIDALDLRAVQHGIRAIEDPALVDLLIERDTVLHICPTSNRSLGVCADIAAHPAHQLFERGVKITVNTDDFALFGVDVSDELLTLLQMGFSPDEVVQVVETGLAQIPGDVQ